MNAQNRKVMTFVLVMLILGLSSVDHAASAQSPRVLFGRPEYSPKPISAPSANSNCKKLKGHGVQVFDPATGVISGPVTNAGILNGMLEDVVDFAAGLVFTPDPTVISYTTALTITTLHGELKARPVTTQCILTGVGGEWAKIDPDASTGKFAGATGLIYFAFKPVGDPSIGPYEVEITGEICFAVE